MNWLRSTTFCAIVPSQTDAAMKSASAVIAPMPGDGGDLSAADWAKSSRPSSMVALRRCMKELFLRLFLAQVVVANDEVREDEAQRRANRPRNDDTPENPIGKAEDI